MFAEFNYSISIALFLYIISSHIYLTAAHIICYNIYNKAKRKEKEMFNAWGEPVIGNMFYPMVYTETNNENMLNLLDHLCNMGVHEISANRFESLLDEYNVDWDALDSDIQSTVVSYIDID
jgi:tellurite resistance protein TehA-like permease